MLLALDDEGKRVELNRETIMMLNFVGPYIKRILPEFTSLVVA